MSQKSFLYNRLFLRQAWPKLALCLLLSSEKTFIQAGKGNKIQWIQVVIESGFGV